MQGWKYLIILDIHSISSLLRIEGGRDQLNMFPRVSCPSQRSKINLFQECSESLETVDHHVDCIFEGMERDTKFISIEHGINTTGLYSFSSHGQRGEKEELTRVKSIGLSVVDCRRKKREGEGGREGVNISLPLQTRFSCCSHRAVRGGQ